MTGRFPFFQGLLPGIYFNTDRGDRRDAVLFPGIRDEGSDSRRIGGSSSSSTIPAAGPDSGGIIWDGARSAWLLRAELED